MSEKEIIKYAKIWWKFKRPVNWCEREHLKHPCVNTHSDKEHDLALAVSKLIGNKKKKKPVV